MESDKQAFYVESVEGRKFKMVIRGDLGKLSVAKIRRYLRSYGVSDEQQLVARDGATVLRDDMVGDDFGLVCNATLRLRSMARRDSGDSDNAAAAATTTTTTAATGAGAATASSPLKATASHVRVKATTANAHGVRDATHGAAAHDAASASTATATAVPTSSLPARHGGSSGSGGAGVTTAAVSSSSLLQQQQRACDAVCALGTRLGVPLSLDPHSLTCAVATDADVTVMLTYHTALARLYVYATLLTSLPSDAAVRHKLYEVLLEGALLGHEVCGGGVGVSRQHGMVVLTTSIDVRHCSDVVVALVDVLPAFVAAVRQWRALIGELVT